MEFEERIIRDGNQIIKGIFDKYYSTPDYEVHFNTMTGLEVLKGRNNRDPFRTELPLLIDVGIMGSCLNSCSFCYQGPETEPHMTFDNFKMIIDQVKHHTNQVALGGRGDPNLHPEFKEFVEYARDNNVVPNYTTSGINLTDEQIEISKMCGAVAVSDYNKGFTFNALRRLMDEEIKTNIHFIFSNPNYDKAMKIVNGEDAWKGKVDISRLNAIVFLLFKPQGSGKDKPELIPTKGQIKEFANIIFTPKCQFKVGMDSCLINHVLDYSIPNKIQRMAIDTCESSRMSVYISPSMRMIPCSFADHLRWGVNISQFEDIRYIWNDSPNFINFRKIIKNKPNKCPAGL